MHPPPVFFLLYLKQMKVQELPVDPEPFPVIDVFPGFFTLQFPSPCPVNAMMVVPFPQEQDPWPPKGMLAVHMPVKFAPPALEDPAGPWAPWAPWAL
jgi:hypothetical protein